MELNFLKTAHQPVVVITSGARPLGIAVAKAIVSKVQHIFLLDNLSVGNYQNTRGLSPYRNITFINCDITQGLPNNLKKVTHILHLAGTQTSFTQEGTSSLYDLQINSKGTQTLLDFAARSDARFVYTSTTLLYLSAAQKQEGNHTEAKAFGESLVNQYAEKHNLNTSIIRLPHVYGPGMDLENDRPLGRMILKVADGENPTLQGDGLDKHYYLYLSDAAEGISKIVLSRRGKGLIFPLTTQKPVSQTEIASTLGEILNLNCREGKGKHQEETPILHIEDRSNLKLIDWQPVVSLKEGLKNTLDSLPTIGTASEYTTREEKDKIGPIPEKTREILRSVSTKTSTLFSRKNKTHSRKRGYQKHVLFSCVALLLLYLTVFPLLTFAYYSRTAIGNLKAAEGNLQTLNFKESTRTANLAKDQLKRAKQILTSNHNAFVLLSLWQGKKDLLHLYSALELVSETLALSSGTADNLSNAIIKSTPGLLTGQAQPSVSPELFQTTLTNFSGAQEKLLLAQAELKAINQENLFSSFLKNKLMELNENLTQAQENMAQAKSLAQNLPALMGFTKETNLLILIQNSNEIRAGGGFVGSVAQTALNQGVIKEIRVDDVYNLDGKLTEKNLKLEPPDPIKTILGQPNWFLRDANWDADFTQSCEDIRKLYLLESGKKAEGIVAIDLYLIRDLLKLTGPITIATYNEVIDESNFFEKTEMHSEAGFSPGANLKKTFLTSLSQQMLENIIKIPTERYSELGEVVKRNLAEKHLVINTTIPALQALLEQNNWAGRVNTAESNYLYVVDSNVGANKANYYVTRNTDLEISTQNREGLQLGKLTLTYVHTGTSTNWPGGRYNNYLRVLIPNGSRLLSATQNASQAKEKSQDITPEIIQSEESGKKVLAKHIILDPGQSNTLILRYELPEQLAITASNNEMTLVVQKQPGTGKDTLNISLSPPFGRDVISHSENLEKRGDSLRFTGPLTTDQSFRIELK